MELITPEEPMVTRPPEALFDLYPQFSGFRMSLFLQRRCNKKQRGNRHNVGESISGKGESASQAVDCPADRWANQCCSVRNSLVLRRNYRQLLLLHYTRQAGSLRQVEKNAECRLKQCSNVDLYNRQVSESQRNRDACQDERTPRIAKDHHVPAIPAVDHCASRQAQDDNGQSLERSHEPNLGR